MSAGRYAPSPTGQLHLGNLRTAILAWLFARATGRRFVMRIEDLDRVRSGSAAGQLADLRSVGVDWDGPLVRQSERGEHYAAALEHLRAAGRVYECFCTRREIAEASSAPQASGAGEPPPGAYPGTCRDLADAERARRRRRSERPPAIRLRADRGPDGMLLDVTVHDQQLGDFTGAVDDLVLVRGDGVPAYNLAVVVDDAASGIDQVVRGDDLLASSPRQTYLAGMLAVSAPGYAHVPMVLNPAGVRLAKRDGAVTLADLADLGWTADGIRSLLAESLGLAGRGEPVGMEALLERFDPAALPRDAWHLDPADLEQCGR